MISFLSGVLFFALWGLATWYFLWDARGKPGSGIWAPVKGIAVALVLYWIGGFVLRWLFPLLLAIVGYGIAIGIVVLVILAFLGAWGGAFSRMRSRG